MEQEGSSISKSNSLIQIDLFDELGLKQAITKLRWQSKKGKFYKNGTVVECDCCHTPIQIENLGGFFAGSVKVSCSNSTCFLAMLYRYKR